MNEVAERLAELDDEIASHPYHEISHRMEELRVVLNALERNYEILKELIDKWLEDEDSFFNAPHSERMKVRKELYRRLHNYLATYYTQYEFTKNLRNDTIGADSNEYKELLEENDIRPTSDFIKALRNYIQKHVFLNVTTSLGSLTEDTPPIRTYLSGEELMELKSSYRNEMAERFIESYESDEIIITEVIETHHENLMNFHDGFRDLILDEFQAEVEEYTSLQAEFTELAKERFANQ